MAWLRVDDKFARHPKLLQLPRKDRWTWIEVLCYCAEYSTDGHIHRNITQAVPLATPRFIQTCADAGLVDLTDDNQPYVHDWDTYNRRDVTAAERQRKHRDSNGNVTPMSHEETVTPPLQKRDSRAGTRARTRPVPLNTPPPDTAPKDAGTGAEAGIDYGKVLRRLE